MTGLFCPYKLHKAICQFTHFILIDFFHGYMLESPFVILGFVGSSLSLCSIFDEKSCKQPL